MSGSRPDDKMGISSGVLEIKTALRDKYDELKKEEKLFQSEHALFCAGLVYGLMHNKRHDAEPNSHIVRLASISNRVSRDVIDIVYHLLDDGTGKDKGEVWKQMLSIADGGVFALAEIYQSHKNFRIPYLLREAEELWPERIKDFHSIKLDQPVN